MSDLSVGEVAQRAGVKVSTLHFYEKKGLITSRRNAGNQRRYDRTVLRVIALIKTAQQLGLGLNEVADAIATLPNKSVKREDWERLSRQWQAGLTQRIERLTQMRDELDFCIGCGCLSMDKCKLHNPDDELGTEGNGPVRWNKIGVTGNHHS